MPSNLKNDRVDITNGGTTRAFSHDGTNAGFLKTDGASWDMYCNNAGQVWTADYGWLHSYFFSTVANCGGAYNIINCYGSGNISAQIDELLDEGGQIRIRSVRQYYNCACACDCNCNCGW